MIWFMILSMCVSLGVCMCYESENKHDAIGHWCSICQNIKICTHVWVFGKVHKMSQTIYCSFWQKDDLKMFVDYHLHSKVNNRSELGSSRCSHISLRLYGRELRMAECYGIQSGCCLINNMICEKFLSPAQDAQTCPCIITSYLVHNLQSQTEIWHLPY